ncbi:MULTISPECIES: hypothetical protein [Parachlamydia]|jgi:hypothetical protein|uniref:Uncharacterized protein n=2 Tax=Parachlamydia acanthamoebae TaxID=83552 RepID=F8L2D9_PARAV|nr:hypothetical protein [Parachlamydia acanthamoebae]EFB41732.1 hypothetical protein pah_c023o017 [Parachlamydia acanthamoebae str. Hall's coccus]CCB87452.1 putative uncharacterized protein [Parachlamydia acanthamoebae UV-7]
MKENHILEQIQIDLSSERYDCSLVMASEEIPFDQLLVFLGNDAKEREKILQITTFKQTMAQESKKKEESYHLVKFVVNLPFSVEPSAASQTASTLLFINRFLELPGFELGELEDQVFYRYVLFTKGNKVDPLLLFSLIGNVMMIIDLFNGVIESVASGEKTFNDLLEEMLSLTK